MILKIKNKDMFRIVGFVVLMLSLNLNVFNSFGANNTRKILTFSELNKLNIDSKTLIIFSIDNVLIYNQDVILQTHNKKEKNELWDKVMRGYADKDKDDFLSIQIMNRSVNITDKKLPEIINQLRQRGAKVMAISPDWSGRFGQINSMESFVASQLKEFGYDFDSSFDGMSLILSDVITPDPSRYALFKYGILFTCHLAPSVVLESFFSKIKNYHLSKVIIISGLNKHINSVALFASDVGIEFSGFFYHKILNGIHSKPNLDKAENQFKNLRDRRIWLHDPDA